MTRSFPTKTRVIWVPGIYIYIYVCIYRGQICELLMILPFGTRESKMEFAIRNREATQKPPPHFTSAMFKLAALKPDWFMGILMMAS